MAIWLFLERQIWNTYKLVKPSKANSELLFDNFILSNPKYKKYNLGKHNPK